MLTPEQHRAVAADLMGAERDRSRVPPPSRTHPEMTIADAYAIQQVWAAERVAAGARIVGHKIGLTSRAMQIALQMTEPDYGFLTDDMVLNDGVSIDVAQFIEPRLEVELAFVLRDDLRGPDLQVHDVLRVTEYVMPAVEIIDFRTEPPRLITDTIADNAAAAALVIGGRVIRPTDLDIRWVAATLSKNGVIEESGVSAAVLGHPAAGIAWLANKLAALDRHLEAGQLLLAGSFTRPVAIAPRDVIHADYGPLGSLGMSFR